MKLSAQSHASIAAALRQAASVYPSGGGKTVITDIHLQPRQDSGELVLYDDDDKELARVLIAEWVDYREADFEKVAEGVLREELLQLKEKGAMDALCIVKPYSFVLVDYDKETLSELLIMDDEDTLLLSEELLKGLDEELDAFLEDLLKD